MEKHRTTFRTTPETLAALDAIAHEAGTSRNQVLNQAVQGFIAYQDWFKEQVASGIRAADKGEFADPEEIAALFARFEK